jgi:hypothetical protein
VCRKFLKRPIERRIEGKIEERGKRGRRRKQLLDDLKEQGIYWKLKQKALDRTLWRIRFESGCTRRPVLRHYVVVVLVVLLLVVMMMIMMMYRKSKFLDNNRQIVSKNSI